MTRINTRREFLKLASLTASSCVGGFSGLTELSAAASMRSRQVRRPNIVLIMTDDQGYGDVGFHGNDGVQTPHLDGLARESTECTHFYASAVCAPTRASLMTGRYHYRTGVIHTSRGAAKMHRDEVTIAEILAENGYATGIFGKWHLGDNYPMRPMDQGFDESLVHTSGGLCQTPDLPNDYFDPKLWHNGEVTRREGYCTDIFTDAAIQFMRDRQEDPFFVYLPMNAPHTPLIVGEEYSRPYEDEGLSPDLARLYGMITNIDDNVGRLITALDEMGLAEDTIVIFMGDNGPGGGIERHTAGLRSGKGSVYDGGIRVPFLVRWPGQFSAGRPITEPLAHIDVMPTLLEICGVGAPTDRTIDGESFLPLLTGDSAELSDRQLVFQWHRGMDPRMYQNAAVRGRRYKLVAHAGLTAEQTDDQLPLEPAFELYDIVADPGETSDIAADHPETVAAMREAYDDWFEDVRSTRDFGPGIIHVGSPHENPIHLCRYQDSSYVGGIPRGWPVTVERGGRYRIAINRIGHMNAGQLHVEFNGAHSSRRLAKGVHQAVFDLPAGSGVLEVWLELDEGGRVTWTDNHTLGDLDITFLG